MAGGVYGQSNNSYYLYTGQNYWMMSPSYFYSSGNAYVFSEWSDGYLNFGRVGNAYGVRPVINIASNVTITGSGTISDPYVVN